MRSVTTALGIAALRGHKDTICLLLENGAGIYGEPKYEEMPPSLALHVYGFPRLVVLLLVKGAPIHPPDLGFSSRRCSILHFMSSRLYWKRVFTRYTKMEEPRLFWQRGTTNARIS